MYNNYMKVNSAQTRFLSLPEGRVAYALDGEGPLVVLVPGMGDLRGTYRMLAPILRDVGYRVACTDLRGHGDSDVSFKTYGDVETSSDIVVLIDQLGGPAFVIGNSMGAGAAVLVATESPALVLGLVLVGPFVRDPKASAVSRILLRLAMAQPWAAFSWKSYLPKLYAGRKPDDFDEYRDQLVTSIRRPGHAKAFSLTTRTSHAAAEAKLSEVSKPTLVVMGERDPDFPDPRIEAEWIAHSLHGQVTMVPEAGHYPQSQQPELTGDAIVRFFREVRSRG
jgi:pimeloyl-ACP methyl ester carboxylesterase